MSIKLTDREADIIGNLLRHIAGPTPGAPGKARLSAWGGSFRIASVSANSFELPTRAPVFIDEWPAMAYAEAIGGSARPLAVRPAWGALSAYKAAGVVPEAAPGAFDPIESAVEKAFGRAYVDWVGDLVKATCPPPSPLQFSIEDIRAAYHDAPRWGSPFPDSSNIVREYLRQLYERPERDRRSLFYGEWPLAHDETERKL